MQLSKFPRRRYTPGPTPIERLDRLSGLLGGPEIWIKRDDLLGLAAGGNKTRKLEFLVADALSRGADTLITVGAVQSNHCRLTLAAAVKEGLKCRLVLEQRVPGSYDPKASGNNFLFDLLGVEAVTVVELGADLEAAMQAVADELSAEGRKGYVIPGGGSNALGALGYVACAQEVLGQGFEADLAFDHLVCASGSAGTHAGLLGRAARRQCTAAHNRHQRAAPAPGAGGQCPQAGRPDRFLAAGRGAAARGPSPAWMSGWAAAIPSPPTRWSRRCGCWRGPRVCCSTRSIPARPWPG